MKSIANFYIMNEYHWYFKNFFTLTINVILIKTNKYLLIIRVTNTKQNTKTKVLNIKENLTII